MSLGDTPLNQSVATIVGGYVPVVLANGSERKIPISELLAVLSGDVDSSVASGDTVAARLNVAVGTTPTITLPAAAGTIRSVVVVNTASGNCTLDTPGSEKILTGTAEADTLVIPTGKAAELFSDGTRWYRISVSA